MEVLDGLVLTTTLPGMVLVEIMVATVMVMVMVEEVEMVNQALLEVSEGLVV